MVVVTCYMKTREEIQFGDISGTFHRNDDPIHLQDDGQRWGLLEPQHCNEKKMCKWTMLQLNVILDNEILLFIIAMSNVIPLGRGQGCSTNKQLFTPAPSKDRSFSFSWVDMNGTSFTMYKLILVIYFIEILSMFWQSIGTYHEQTWHKDCMLVEFHVICIPSRFYVIKHSNWSGHLQSISKIHNKDLTRKW